MKRALVLSLAISLALGAGQALAVGLGQIQVKSRLNQPLVAEIPVTVDRGSDAESLAVGLASAEEFARIGIERSQIGVPLEFTLVKGENGKAVIRITSSEPVRSPFLDFLIAANWSNGRVLREYTVLLDPPTTAPAVAAVAQPAQVQRQSATAPPPADSTPVDSISDADAPESAQPQSSTAEPSAPPVAVVPAKAVPEAYRAPQETRQAASTQQPSQASIAGSDGRIYGPVATGETLSQIAKANLPGSDVSANQMMVAMLNANPQAFSQNNINRLKSGAILRIPSPEEIRAVGSMQTAAAQVRSQNEQWRGEAAEPTLVAGPAASSVGVADFTNATSGPPVDDRLALVPPEMSDDGLASTGQAGSSAGTALGNASASDLARSNEELEARKQETGELRSRVQDLENIQTSNERLISLKDSEIADLQRKLASAQADAEVAPLPTTEPSPTAATEISADIAPVEASLAETTTEAAPVVTASGEVASQIDDASSSADATTADAAAVDAAAAVEPALADSVAIDESSDNLTEVVAGAEAIDPQASTPDAVIAEAPVDAGIEATPVADPISTTEDATAVDSPAILPPDPAQVAVITDTPWYLDARILGGAALLALLLSALVLRSRRKSVETTPGKSSLADKFAGPTGMPPVLGQPDDGLVAAMDEERQLAQLIDEDPTDLGARLELISIYYADNRVDEFRVAALAMQPYVDDPREAEWVQVRAMGEDLMPNDALFATDAVAHTTVESGSDDDWSDSAETRYVADADTVDVVDVETTALMDDPIEAPMSPTTERQPYFAEAIDGIAEPVDILGMADEEKELGDDPLAAIEDDFDEMDAKAAGGLVFTLDDAPELEESSERSAHITPKPDQQASTGKLLTDVSMHDRPPTESFDFDLPPLEFESSLGSSSEVTETAASLTDDGSDDLSDDVSGSDLDDEFLTGEDSLGTKLDLARAYADMGDPDGARSMLEEVLSAGDPEQQEKARRLLAELS